MLSKTLQEGRPCVKGSGLCPTAPWSASRRRQKSGQGCQALTATASALPHVRVWATVAEGVNKSTDGRAQSRAGKTRPGDQFSPCDERR